MNTKLIKALIIGTLLCGIAVAGGQHFGHARRVRLGQRPRRGARDVFVGEVGGRHERSLHLLIGREAAGDLAAVDGLEADRVHILRRTQVPGRLQRRAHHAAQVDPVQLGGLEDQRIAGSAVDRGMESDIRIDHDLDAVIRQFAQQGERTIAGPVRRDLNPVERRAHRLDEVDEEAEAAEAASPARAAAPAAAAAAARGPAARPAAARRQAFGAAHRRAGGARARRAASWVCGHRAPGTAP